MCVNRVYVVIYVVNTFFLHHYALLFSSKLSNLLVHPQIGLLLLESLSILGHFALFHPENQEVLRWGKSPTILHKVSILPYRSHPIPKFHILMRFDE